MKTALNSNNIRPF